MPDSWEQIPEQDYFLHVSETNGKNELFALSAKQVWTIGRASTNRIILDDEICSRSHCEVLPTALGWKLRDRNSRNGTFVNDEPVKQDYLLKNNDLIRIGTTHILFSSSEKLSETGKAPHSEADTTLEFRLGTEDTDGSEILNRLSRSSYQDEESVISRKSSRSSARLSRLYQMALKMGNCQSTREMADLVLDGLVGITGADIGAILSLPEYRLLTDEAEDLERMEIGNFLNLNGREYRKVSRTLSRIVCRSREAVLARDISSNSELSESRDSLNDIQAQSLIVAPIRDGKDLYGLIHLYSTQPENVLDADGLDYTLAVADQFAIALKNYQQKKALREGLKRIQSAAPQNRPASSLKSELVGQSAIMQHLRDTISLVAPTDVVVLIRGESGVGKELVARAIHQNSSRSQKPFVCMNCAALSESLLESELFGHEKGSFTGATGQKAGKFEQAHQGTLFLDEVGEMSPAIQAKFLRVMEGHPFERVGGANSIQVDVRLVAATNRNLEQAVREMTFRKDLYFRLQVLEIVVPPLRERAVDIPLLADFFAARLAQKVGRLIEGFTPEAIEKMRHYDWPGNVRELQNTVERAVVLCQQKWIDENHIKLSQLEGLPFQLTEESLDSAPYVEQSIEEMEKEHILRTLEQTEGNKSKAAQILGIERSTLDRKLKKYGLKN